MKSLLVTFAICLSLSALAQPFKPDAFGHVNGDAFKSFCKKQQYTLIGVFDSLPGDKKGMAAEVIKNGKWIYVDLNGKEFSDHKSLAQHYGFYTDPSWYFIDEDPDGYSAPEVIEMKGYPVTGTFNKNGQTGYKIRDKIIIQPKYDDIEQLWNIDKYLFFRVRKGDLYGICDYQGKEIIPVIYEKLEYLHFNTAQCFFLATKDRKQAVLSRGGIITVPLEYDEINQPTNGPDFVLFTKKNGLTGVISSSGKIILNPEYEAVQLAEYSALNGFIAKQDGKFGYLNKSGIVKVPFEYNHLSYQEGYFLTYRNDKGIGALDTNGTKILEPIYSEIVKPKLGNCFIATVNQNGVKQTGIFDLNGKVIEEPVYGAYMAYGLYYRDNEIYLFAKEKMYYQTGLFNVKTLKWILPCTYNIGIAASNYMVVMKDDSTQTGGKLHGVVDQTGSFIIPCIYSELKYNDIENNAVVLYNGKYGLVGANNKIILPFQYHMLTPLAYSERVYGDRKRIPKGYLIYTENNRKGVLTASGKISIPAAYESIDVTLSGLICVSGDTSKIFSVSGKLYKTVPHVVNYMTEGFFDWREESESYGMDLYGNSGLIPPKPVMVTDRGFPDPPPTPPPVQKADTVKLYNTSEVDEPASFPGGNTALTAFLSKTLKYPQLAIEEGIGGRCYLQFVVEKDGSLTEITVKKKIPDCPECDKEAVRVVKLMPKWNPAKLKGEVVRSSFTMPISFRLD